LILTGIISGARLQQEHEGGDQRRRQCSHQKLQGRNRAIREGALQNGEAGRVRRIGNHRQAAASYRASHQHVAPVFAGSFDQRSQIREGSVVSNGGQRRGTPIQDGGRQPAQEILQPPLLQTT